MNGWDRRSSHPLIAVAAAPSALEQAYLTAVLAVFLAVPFLVSDQPQGAASLNPLKALEALSSHGDSAKQLLIAALYLSVIPPLLRSTWREMAAGVSVPLWLLLAWCFMSAAWTIDGNVSLRRSVAMLGTVLLGLYMGLRFDLRSLLRVMSYVTGVILLGSVAIAVVWPLHGLDFEGRLRGVFAHKNDLSGFISIAVLGVAAQLVVFDYRTRSAAIGDVLLACLCVACLLWSHSAGVVPVLFLALPVLPLTLVFRTADKGILALIPVLVCVGVALLAAAIYYTDEIAEMLGKDADLSGRTTIWNFVIKMFFNQLWVGYGYGTFWEGFNSPGGVFWSISSLGAPHSHNGYLELAVDTGAVGLVLLGASIAVLMFRLSWLIRHGRDLLICWPVAFLVLYLVMNLGETRLWTGNQVYPLFFVCIVVYTNRTIRMTAAAGCPVKQSALSFAPVHPLATGAYRDG